MAEEPALRTLYTEERHTRRFIREGFIYFALIHAQLAAVLLGALPRWSLPLVLPVWMARLMIGRHELIHVRREGAVDLFTRLWPVLAMVTPLSVGYREHRLMHNRHHAVLLSEDDPDRYQIVGSKLSGFFHCFTSPEQNLFRWTALHGWSSTLIAELLARAAFFFAMVVICGPVFLWYWVPLRVTYGGALFVFSYVLHRRGPRYGVFAIELGPVGVALFVMMVGRLGWLAVCNHDVHHVNSNLSPLRLVEAREMLAR